MARRKPSPPTTPCLRCCELEAELQELRDYYGKLGHSMARLVGELLNKLDHGGLARRNRVLELRASGRTRQEIADELGITLGGLDAILYNKRRPKPPVPG